MGGEGMKVGVLGAGAWGTAFAYLLLGRGHEVTLVDSDEEVVGSLTDIGRNLRHLPGLELKDVKALTTRQAGELFERVDLVVVAVPSRAFATAVAALPGSSPLLSLTKGLDPISNVRLSTLVEGRPLAVLSGPNFAEEIAAGLPAAAVIASKDVELATRLQAEIASTSFRVYVNADLVGVELCGAGKNVIALAAGAVDGLGLGDNAKATLMTRGLAEMTRFGLASGARADTFAGLAGMGDLIATCWHQHGRNRRAGELIGRGVTPEQAREQIGTVEGMTAAPVLSEMARQAGVELPITEAVCAVLGGGEVKDLAVELMGRKLTGEWSASPV
ncbi:MAG: NAD(P)H-dependent glycerol-3-phosphate dehydrogenase [Gaiellaceae bacterium]